MAAARPTASTPDLEQALQDAFVRGEFDRLLTFACVCASRTLHPATPASWRAALALADLRAQGQIDPAAFAAEARQVKEQLPIAATVVGLKHGIPSAATLLAIVAALDPGPLSAALGAAAHHRLHTRMKARELSAEAFSLAGPVMVDLERGRVLDDGTQTEPAVERSTAAWQLSLWRSLGDPRAFKR